ncbi:MAG: DUF3106 domain-containing protein [Syntrophotaleaceae bacterium]
MKRFLLPVLALVFGLVLIHDLALAKNLDKFESFESWRIARADDDRGQYRHEDRREMTPDQRRELERRYQKFRELSPEEQQKLRQRYERFKDMSPQKQQEMLERHQRIQQLTPQQQEELKRDWQQLKELPPDERSLRRQEIRRKFFDENGHERNGKGGGRR